jgi:hypothetical protein
MRGVRRAISLPYFEPRPRATRNASIGTEARSWERIAATIIYGMRPQTIGRTLGIGLRVAGRIAGQRMAANAQAQAAQPFAGAGVAAQVGEARRAVSAGVGGFLRPFRRVGGILWLEITGAFFLLPALAFAPTLWRTRLSWLHGTDHRTFWAAAVVVTLFLYLGLSSFWRARRRESRD